MAKKLCHKVPALRAKNNDCLLPKNSIALRSCWSMPEALFTVLIFYQFWRKLCHNETSRIVFQKFRSFRELSKLWKYASSIALGEFCSPQLFLILLQQISTDELFSWRKLGGLGMWVCSDIFSYWQLFKYGKIVNKN